ncbi:MAG: hypothetical protein MUP63_00225 [Candidatus Nanohaloarchaeota archaeon QJJ-7]|nr:hypothetical protein [Candidatus Nanohaloarchaeota archaeon QJJ-7]
MVERRLSWEFIFIAIIITGAIMAGMFFLGLNLSEIKVNELEEDVERFQIEQKSQDLTLQMSENLLKQDCQAMEAMVQETTKEVGDLQQQVATYEQTNRLGNNGFLLKERYMNALIEYWTMVERVNEECGSEVLSVAYIYHDSDKCPRCEDQGTLLSSYKQQYGENLLVFPLDASLDMKHINTLIEAYDVERYPALIINDTAYEGFKDREALGNILETHMEEN